MTGVEFGNSRGSYAWTAYVGGMLNATYYNLYPSIEGFAYTIGDVPESDQLLLNDSFEETAARANFPTDWTAKNLTSGAGQKWLSRRCDRQPRPRPQHARPATVYL